MSDSLQDFIDEAAAFFEGIISAIEGAFGANNPMSNAIVLLQLPPAWRRCQNTVPGAL